MARRERSDSKSKKVDHSQRMSRLKAKALNQVAKRAWSTSVNYKTIPLLLESLRRDPKNIDTLIALATACGKQRFYDKAEQYLAQVLELAPRKAAVHRRVAQTYAAIDRPERAIECYRHSLELNRETSVTVPTLVELARLLERRHQVDDAREVVDEAFRREPKNGEARLLRAVLDRRRGDSAAAESQLAALVAEDSLPAPLRSQAAYELAQLQDEQDRFDEAFSSLVAAKRFIKRFAAPFRERNLAVVNKNRELVDAIDKPTFERWIEAARHDAPCRIAALTSHPRSGTTLVEQVLDSHDGLKSADEFDVYSNWVQAPIVRKFPANTRLLDILDRVPAAVRQQARATYWQQTEAIFAEPIGDRILLDKNPGMMIMLPAVNWLFLEMKLLIALRDPRDVVLSCFMQKVPLTPISSNWLSLEDAAAYYACSMETWLKVRELTPSPGLEFRYEDVVTNLEAQARQILDFLELPWNDRVLKFYEHAREKAVRSPTYKDVTKPVYQRSVGRWQNYARHLAPILEPLSKFVNEFGYDA